MIILCTIFSPFIPSNRYMIVMAIALVFHPSFPFFFVIRKSGNQFISSSGNPEILVLCVPQTPPGIAECF